MCMILLYRENQVFKVNQENLDNMVNEVSRVHRESQVNNSYKHKIPSINCLLTIYLLISFILVYIGKLWYRIPFIKSKHMFKECLDFPDLLRMLAHITSN